MCVKTDVAQMKVEGVALKCERRIGSILKAMEGRTEVGLDPLDTRTVDVAPPELGPLGFGEKVAEDAGRSTPKIEDAFAVEGPLRWEQVLYAGANRRTLAIVGFKRISAFARSHAGR
jgi:hypothetical protein